MDKIPKLNKNKSSSTETVNSKRLESTSKIKTVQSPALTSADRCKSATTLQRQESHLSSKSSSDEKIKTPAKTRGTHHGQAERTPVLYFSTSKSSITKTDGTPFRTPVKRYFSDNTMTQSTPDCFGAVQFETPRSKTDNGVDEATLYDEESSNLTVGVRIRPMNFK